MDGVQIGTITIPAIKGDKGDKGDAGKIVGLSVTMLDSTATPTVVNTGTQYEANYQLGIPRGTGVSSAVINEDGELVITLSDNTELNLGVVIPTSISNVTLDANYDFIVTYSDGTTTTVGNIASEIQGLIDTALTDYYDKDTTNDILDDLADDIKGTYGHSLSLSLNQSTYVMTIGLVDYNGTTLDTKTVDLPLESVVVSGSYDKTTKEVVLTLQNGSTVRFSVADLVAGLQTEITSNNKLASDLVDDTNQTHKFVSTSEKTTWNAKVDVDDYANGSTGGVFKTSSGYGTEVSATGFLRGVSKDYATYENADVATLISKGTLENVLAAVVGDINSLLDTINGEVV